MRVVIRALTPADADAAAALHALCFEKGWPAQDFVGYALDPAIIARIDAREGVIAGLLVATLAAREAEVLTLVVHPAHRRAGIGMALLRDMMEQGAAAWILDVAADNLAAIRLYTRFGGVLVRRRKAYYANGVDALVMAGPISAMD